MPYTDPKSDAALNQKFRDLLEEISKEQVPPAIFQLAQQLQTLLDQHAAAGATED